MTEETTIGTADTYRLLLLIDHLEREGKSEAEITDAVDEVTKEEDSFAARAA